MPAPTKQQTIERNSKRVADFRLKLDKAMFNYMLEPENELYLAYAAAFSAQLTASLNNLVVLSRK